MDESIVLPSGARAIIGALHRAGFEGYAVGGCIRDSLLGKTPNDWDITTNALPEDVIRLFQKNHTIPTGLRHGTVTVMQNGSAYEITTYRVDGKYSDGRHPDKVAFAGDLRLDLERRDFTVNAMAYNEETGLVDLFGGRADLAARQIRTVGSASDRFGEDYLRMLRAYRFSASLGFDISEEIKDACSKYKLEILKVSAERIQAEFTKMILGEHFERSLDFFDMFCEVLFPELALLRGVPQNTPYHKYDVYNHTMTVFLNSERNLVQRICALFHDSGKFRTHVIDRTLRDHFYGHPDISVEIAGNVLKRLKYDNKTIREALVIIKNHDNKIEPDRRCLRRLISQIGEEATRGLIRFRLADTAGKSDFAIQKYRPKILKCAEIFEEITASGEACSVKALKIDGDMLKARFSLHEGEIIGQILNRLLEAVLDEPELNEEETLLEMAEELIP